MKYRRIYPTVWTGRRYRSLPAPAPNPQLLFHYFLTGPETTAIPGVVLAGRGTLAESLRWSLEELDAQLGLLERAGLMVADREARFIVLVEQLEAAHPDNPNVAHHWALVLAEAPECGLRDHVIEQVTKSLSPVCARTAEAFVSIATRQPFRKPFPKGFTGPSTRASRNNKNKNENENENENEHESNSNPDHGCAASAAVGVGDGEEDGGRSGVPASGRRRRPNLRIVDAYEAAVNEVRAENDGCGFALTSSLRERAAMAATLHRVVAQYAARGRERLDGEAAEAWMRQAIRAFVTHGAVIERPRVYCWFEPRGFDKWLGERSSEAACR